MKIIASIEARMGSTRLPGKTLLDLCGMTVIEHIVERLGVSRKIESIVVATTTSDKDSPINELCVKRGFNVYRGSENDVLKRVIEAADSEKADIIVQLGADNLFYDPYLIDAMIDIFESNEIEYLANDFIPTFPFGPDIHIVTLDSLKKADEETDDVFHRENVVTYLWEHPDKYPLGNILAPAELKHPGYRLTLDYQEDWSLIEKIFPVLYSEKKDFTLLDTVNYLENHPELVLINKNVEQTGCPDGFDQTCLTLNKIISMEEIYK